MQVYEIKRKIKQKNEWIYNILKKEVIKMSFNLHNGVYY